MNQLDFDCVTLAGVHFFSSFENSRVLLENKLHAHSHDL